MSAALRMEQWCHFRKLGKFLFISAARNHLLLSTVCAECHTIKRNTFSAAIDAEHGTILHVSKYQSGLLTVVENGSVANAESCKIFKERSDRMCLAKIQQVLDIRHFKFVT